MKPTRRFAIIALAIALAGCATAASVFYPVSRDALKARPGDYLVDPDHASVVFAVDHLGFSTYYGRFTDISGRLSFNPAAPESSEVAVRIGAASIDTPSAELNERLRSAAMFDAVRHPDILFVATRVAVIGDNAADIEGVLTVKERSGPVVVRATFRGGGVNPATGRRTLGFEGTSSFSRSAFGLSQWSGFVGDDVKLIISAEFVAAE